MSDFTAYAIRQKSTGHFLPMRWHNRRGYSHDKPTEGAFPRLFLKRSAAHLARVAWLKGEWQCEVEHDDWGGGPYTVGAYPVHDPSRKADDMEIVRLEINVVNNVVE